MSFCCISIEVPRAQDTADVVDMMREAEEQEEGGSGNDNPIYDNDLGRAR